MLSSEEMSAFFQENTGIYFSTDDRNMLLAYAIFVQARLNTNLAYINNEALMRALGLSSEEVLDEIRRLSEIARKIKIPEPVKTNQK